MKRQFIPIVILLFISGTVAVWWFSRARPVVSDSRSMVSSSQVGDGQSQDIWTATETDVPTLDPIKTLDPHVMRIIGQVYEGLVGLDKANQVVPKIAESWTSNDRFDRWTFNIRSGVRFHPHSLLPKPNREVGSADVIFSLNRIASKSSMSAFLLDGVVKRLPDGELAIKALDGDKAKGTSDSCAVEIELIAPDPFFAQRLAATPLVIVPREIGQLPEGEFGTKTIIGTGPFLVVSRSDAQVVLRRNEGHWDRGANRIARLEFKTIKNDQLRLQELKADDFGVVRIPASVAEGILSSAGAASVLKPEWHEYRMQVVPSFNTVVLGFNCEKLDLSFRRAITFAICRADLAKLSPKGLSEAVSGPIPLSIPGHRSGYDRDIYDPTTAKAELGKSKFQGPLEILVHERDNSEVIGQLLQSQLKDVGIECKLTRLDYNAVIGRMVSGDFGAFIMAFEFTYPAAPPIADMLFNPAKIPVPNFWRYKNQEVAHFLDEYRSAATPAVTARITAQIEKAVVDDPPAAFLLQNKTLWLRDRRLSEIPVNGQSVPLFWETRLEQIDPTAK